MSFSNISAACRRKLKLGSNWIYGNIRYSPKAPLIYDFFVYGSSVLLFDELAFTLCVSVLFCRSDTGQYGVPFPHVIFLSYQALSFWINLWAFCQKYRRYFCLLNPDTPSYSARAFLHAFSCTDRGFPETCKTTKTVLNNSLLSLSYI